jgi:hypothetical protein
MGGPSVKALIEYYLEFREARKSRDSYWITNSMNDYLDDLSFLTFVFFALAFFPICLFLSQAWVLIAPYKEVDFIASIAVACASGFGVNKFVVLQYRKFLTRKYLLARGLSGD